MTVRRVPATDVAQRILHRSVESIAAERSVSTRSIHSSEDTVANQLCIAGRQALRSAVVRAWLIDAEGISEPEVSLVEFITDPVAVHAVRQYAT